METQLEVEFSRNESELDISKLENLQIQPENASENACIIYQHIYDRISDYIANGDCQGQFRKIDRFDYFELFFPVHFPSSRTKKILHMSRDQDTSPRNGHMETFNSFLFKFQFQLATLTLNLVYKLSGFEKCENRCLIDCRESVAVVILKHDRFQLPHEHCIEENVVEIPLIQIYLVHITLLTLLFLKPCAHSGSVAPCAHSGGVAFSRSILRADMLEPSTGNSVLMIMLKYFWPMTLKTFYEEEYSVLLPCFLRLISILIENGDNILSVNKQGCNILHLSYIVSYEDIWPFIERKLTKATAYELVNHVSCDGYTPLEFIMKNDNYIFLQGPYCCGKWFCRNFMTRRLFVAHVYKLIHIGAHVNTELLFRCFAQNQCTELAFLHFPEKFYINKDLFFSILFMLLQAGLVYDDYLLVDVQPRKLSDSFYEYFGICYYHERNMTKKVRDLLHLSAQKVRENLLPNAVCGVEEMRFYSMETTTRLRRIILAEQFLQEQAEYMKYVRLNKCISLFNK